METLSPHLVATSPRQAPNPGGNINWTSRYEQDKLSVIGNFMVTHIVGYFTFAYHIMSNKFILSEHQLLFSSIISHPYKEGILSSPQQKNVH